MLLAVLLALGSGALSAPGATAKGMNATIRGATVSGLPYRYVAISPNIPYRAQSPQPSVKFTVIGRIDKRGGRLSRWWYLPGQYSIPGAAYDDRSGGLAAEGGTLVLSRFSRIYPPRTTGLAILDTRLHLRHPRGEGRPQHAIRKLRLPGSFSFDAVSPDGSIVYLIQHLSPYFGGAYQVRALDSKRGVLLPEPIVDPEEPEERMEGVPISRATSPDGRWAYTLYSGDQADRAHEPHEPFIHALDTVGQRAVCIDLPQLKGQRSPFQMALRMGQQGHRLTVLNHRPSLQGVSTRALLRIDTHSFEVRRPAPVATASSGIGPWPPIAVLGVGVVLLLSWIGMRHRHASGSGPAAQE